MAEEQAKWPSEMPKTTITVPLACLETFRRNTWSQVSAAADSLQAAATKESFADGTYRGNLGLDCANLQRYFDVAYTQVPVPLEGQREDGEFRVKADREALRAILGGGLSDAGAKVNELCDLRETPFDELTQAIEQVRFFSGKLQGLGGDR